MQRGDPLIARCRPMRFVHLSKVLQRGAQVTLPVETLGIQVTLPVETLGALVTLPVETLNAPAPAALLEDPKIRLKLPSLFEEAFRPHRRTDFSLESQSFNANANERDLRQRRYTSENLL